MANVAQVQGNRVQVAQNQSLPSPPSAPFCSISVSQKNRPHCPKENLRKSFPGPFLLKPRPSRVSLVSRKLGNAAQVQGNRPQVAQDQSFASPPSAPFCSIPVSKSGKPATLPKRKFAQILPWAVLLKVHYLALRPRRVRLKSHVVFDSLQF